MPKKLSRTTVTLNRCKVSVFLALGLLLTLGVVFPGARQGLVQAATCNSSSSCLSQINSLNASNSASQGKLSDLTSQATSYEQVIHQLQSRIESLQRQISKNKAQQAKLQSQIAAMQKQIDQEKAVLGDILRSMYIDGQMTTIEMLATSNNLSDYVDKQEYRNSVQDKVQDTLAQIAALQEQLQAKKTAVDNLIATEQTSETQVESDKAQQSQLLSFNESQQAAYNAKIAANTKSISSLYARLAALNSAGAVSFSGTCGGSYPKSAVSKINGVTQHWGCSYGQDSAYDNWHMLNRECVSYTAWMVYQDYGISTYGWGSAYNWINEARSKGYRVDQSPSAGSIAIRDIDYDEPGDVGHAMYVVSVNGSDSITVNEYNEHYNGTFDQRTFAPSSYNSRGGLYFIHFR